MIMRLLCSIADFAEVLSLSSLCRPLPMQQLLLMSGLRSKAPKHTQVDFVHFGVASKNLLEAEERNKYHIAKEREINKQ